MVTDPLKRAYDRVHVSIPYRMLVADYLPRVLERGMHVELGMDSLSLDAFDSEHMRRTAEEFHARGRRLSIHAPFLDLSPGSLDDWVLDVTKRRYEQLLERVGLFRPVTVVLHTGWDRLRYAFFEELWFERAAGTVDWFARRLAEECDAVLTVENVFERTPSMIRRLFDELANDRVGFCFDTGHMNAFSTTTLGDWLSELGPDLREIHVHDNTGAADEHLAVGRGDVDWPRLFEYLHDNAMEPVITCEAHTPEGVRESMEFLAPWL
ncbi:MAG: sugar phosphate isomerase/epimerase family protein [Desulfatibacillaceae bacterium]